MVVKGQDGMDVVLSWMSLQGFRFDAGKITGSVVTRAGRARIASAVRNALRAAVRPQVRWATSRSRRGIATRQAVARRAAATSSRPRRSARAA